MKAKSYEESEDKGTIARFLALGLLCSLPNIYAQVEVPTRLDRIYDQFPTGDTPSLLPWMSVADVASRFLPYGQVFVPQHSSLDFVELILYYRRPDTRPGDSQTLMVQLHSGNSLEGPVVSSSEPLVFNRSVDPQYPGFVEFPFMEPVVLEPGMPYTLEVSHLAGDEILALAIIPGGPDTYPPGWAYGGGGPPPGIPSGTDIWFRTGTIIPEPSPAALLVIGGALLLAGRRRWRGVKVRQRQ